VCEATFSAGYAFLADAGWSLIEEMSSRPIERWRRLFTFARFMLEAIIYRYRTRTERGGICLRCSARGRRRGPDIARWLPRWCLGQGGCQPHCRCQCGGSDGLVAVGGCHDRPGVSTCDEH